MRIQYLVTRNKSSKRNAKDVAGCGARLINSTTNVVLTSCGTPRNPIYFGENIEKKKEEEEEKRALRDRLGRATMRTMGREEEGRRKKNEK